MLLPKMETFIPCWLLLMVMAVVMIEAQDDISSKWAEYQNQTAIEAGQLIGSGLLSTTEVMREQILAYKATNTDESSESKIIRYVYKTQSEFQCRMYGYLRACPHPFPDFGGSPLNTDFTPPYSMDFLIVNDYIKASTYKLPDVKHFPIFVAGVVPIFNIPGVSRLILDFETVARIFRGCQVSTVGCLPGSISMWNDSAIKDTNPPSVHPFLDAAGPIKRIVRRESTGATEIIRRALSKFEPEFAQQVGVSNTNVWPAVDIFDTIISPEGIIDLVYQTPSSISYIAANLLETADIGVIDLIENGSITSADADGLAASVEDFGLAFGNDGRDPSENTVDLTGSRASRAWPISYYSYLVVRTNRTDDSCFNKTTLLLDFLSKMYLPTDPDADRGALSRGLAPIPRTYAGKILDLIRNQLRCNGTLVYDFPAPPANIVVFSEQSSRGAMEVLARSFEQIHGSSEVSIDVRPSVSYEDLKVHFRDGSTGCIILADQYLRAEIMGDLDPARAALVSLPYAVTSGSFIYNFCGPNDAACTLNSLLSDMILDIPLVVSILSGEVTWWNDSRIAAFNPTMTLPSERINLFLGPLGADLYEDFKDRVAVTYQPDFSFSPDAQNRSTFSDVYRAVSVIPFSFSFVSQNGTIISRVMKVTLQRPGGVPIANTIGNLEACAEDTYQPSDNAFILSSSTQPLCYPVIDLVTLISRQQYRTEDDQESRTAVMTARFLKFVVDSAARPTAESATVLTSLDYGTLSDFRSGSYDVADRNRKLLESIALNDVSILLVPHNMRWVPQTLIDFVYSFVAISLIVYIGLAIWVMRNKDRKLIRNSSPTFMLQILFGASLMVVTIIPLSQQDSFREPQGMTMDDLNPSIPQLNAACAAQPVLFSLGFFLLFSALFLKAWRLIRIFNNKKLRNLFLRDRQLLVYQSAVMIFVVGLNLFWIIYSPLVWKRSTVFVDTELGLVVDSAGLCYSNEGVFPALPLAVGIVICLIMGNYIAYLGRKIPTEFDESRWIAMSMVVALEAVVMGIPILVISNDQPVAGFIVKAFLILVIPGATVALIFVPKIGMAYGWGILDGESNPWRFVKAGSSGSNNYKDSKDSKGRDARARSASANPDASQNQDYNISTYHKVGSKKNGLVAPSLNSLVSGKIVVASSENARPISLPNSPVRDSHDRSAGDKAAAPSIAQLKQVLESDPTRRRFRRYLQTLKMDENIKFWDCVAVFRAESTQEKRASSARAIISTFVSDSAPFQVNLSSAVRDEMMIAYAVNDRHALGQIEFFSKALDELFKDLRQSDAFRTFMENDTFTSAALPTTLSDPVIMVENRTQ